MLYAVSALGIAFAWDPPSFMVFRFLAGLGIGASSVTTPVYISEIAPPEKRGRLVAMFQFNIVAGILAAYVSNWLLGGLGPNDWRFMLGVQALPAVLYLSAACLIPESPRWLAVSRGRMEEARAILARSDGGARGGGAGRRERGAAAGDAAGVLLGAALPARSCSPS